MKSLNDYITEWKASTNTVSSIKKTQYFIYELKINKRIKIFDVGWQQFKDYKDKVYVNSEHVELGDDGYTKKEYDPGTYEVEIKDIDNVTNCNTIFFHCMDLIKVPLFNTSKVEDMNGMFFNCKSLKEVPLFNISNVKIMNSMFHGCNTLSDKTKQCWSTVYDFEKHKMNI